MTEKAKSGPTKPIGGGPTIRKRKAHKKSRFGCRNCKLRRIKCNEARPNCEQCLRFEVLCNYGPSVPDLQPCSASSNVVQMESVLDKSPLLTAQPVLDMVSASLQEDSLGSGWKPGVMRFDNADLARLDKFQSRTVLTIGVKRVARLLQQEVIQLACTHRFLMHLVQVVTACHDRYLCGVATARPSRAETYHMSQALAAFQTILSRPIHHDDRDALMLASSLLGVASFFNLEASTIEEVWPLADSDMSWLNLSDGKRTVWKLAKPLRAESLWQEVGRIYDRDHTLATELSEHVPSIFAHLFSNDLSSQSAAANPCYKTSRALLPLLELECNDSTWLQFLEFLCHLDPPYKLLLQQRDPWALLILCYWYMKVCRGAWWVSSRCILQGQAICLYLERYHSTDAAIQAALKQPRLEFEAAQMDGWGGISFVVHRPQSATVLQWM
ncbi:hypothetical protein A1O7_03856 [Cladophialophora yegresii CBS 114405]|uniref:Zn(2)-C6 fungal-type domain-containing protein n=1 Tax=Cladophialophora yegresii CBS 114405 TaxID=1182544 RepID=W9W3X9_9EURO|nr:uncharacterized protein A1O7_03856 [Cladophialophora yegresii CBS 114405]EXJ59710.1 hypothetical protein A1O7_03856 [Cladophialophora yegresii CBS 114405]